MGNKVSPGDPLKVVATDYNRMLDAADYYAAHRLGSGGGSGPLSLPHTKIKISNSSGADVGIGGVLKLGAPLLDEHDNAMPWFDGATPTDRIAPFAILLEPLPEDGIGAALMTGICKAQVDVQNVDHRWADMTTTADNLKSFPTGAAKILETPDGTGVKTLWVQLGIPFRGTLIGKPDSGISANSSGTVSVYKSSDRTDTGYNLTCYTAVALTANKWVTIEEAEGTYMAYKWEC